jgi:hypothetical protein
MESRGAAMKEITSNGVKRLATSVGFCLVICSLLLAALPPAQLFAQRAAQPAGRQMKVVLARQSTADPIEIMKHLSQNCPNITITTNPKTSDYMLYAGGWSGGYRFMVIAKGGDTIYATETVLLSSAVKNVCKFLDARQ